MPENLYFDQSLGEFIRATDSKNAVLIVQRIFEKCTETSETFHITPDIHTSRTKHEYNKVDGFVVKRGRGMGNLSSGIVVCFADGAKVEGVGYAALVNELLKAWDFRHGSSAEEQSVQSRKTESGLESGSTAATTEGEGDGSGKRSSETLVVGSGEKSAEEDCATNDTRESA